MSDHPTDQAPAGPVDPATSPSPHPRRPASAASRARRIGGRAAPEPRPHPTRPADGGFADGPADRPDVAEPDGVHDVHGGADVRTDTVAPAGSAVSTVEDVPGAATADDAVGETADEVAVGADRAPVRQVVVLPAWLAWLPAVVLTAGAVAMAVVLVVVGHGVWWDEPGQPSTSSTAKIRDQVTAAAKTCLAAANTYKYTDLPAFRAAGLACSTGQYTTQFGSAYTSLIQKYAPTLKADQTAQINKAGIEAVSDDGQWTLLLYGQLAVTNSSYPKGRTDPFGAEVRMQQVRGHWLISALRTVSSPVSTGS